MTSYAHCLSHEIRVGLARNNGYIRSDTEICRRLNLESLIEFILGSAC
jgi:hypothetical protein